MKRWTTGLMALGVGLLVAGGAVAQDQGNPPAGQPAQPGGGQGGNRGNRGNFDPAAMRQRFYDRIKQDLGASDDEWKALQPKVEKVLDAQRATRGNRGGFGGRTRGGDQSTQPQPQDQSAVAKASADLKAAIDDKSTPPAVLAQKLAALRDAKEKAKADAATAQKELKELLTQRQEAVLVNMGILE